MSKEISKLTKQELLQLLHKKDVELADGSAQLTASQAKNTQLRNTLDLLKEKATSTGKIVEQYQQLAIKFAETDKLLKKERAARLRLEQAAAAAATAAAPSHGPAAAPADSRPVVPEPSPPSQGSAASLAVFGATELQQLQSDLEHERRLRQELEQKLQVEAGRAALGAASGGESGRGGHASDVVGSQERLAALQQQLEQEKQRAKDAARQLGEERQRAARQLEQEKQRASVAAGQLQQSLKEAEGQLEQEKQRTQEAAGQLEQERRRAKAAAGQLEQERQRATDAAGQLEQQKHKAKEAAGQLEQERQKVKETAGQLEQERQKLKEAAGKLEQETRRATEAVKQLEQERQKVKEAALHAEHVGSQQHALAQRQGDGACQDAAVQQLREQLAALQAQDVQGQLQRLQNELQHAQRDVRASDAACTELRQQVAGAGAQREQLEQRVQEAEERVRQLQEELEAAGQQLAREAQQGDADEDECMDAGGDAGGAHARTVRLQARPDQPQLQLQCGTDRGQQQQQQQRRRHQQQMQVSAAGDAFTVNRDADEEMELAGVQPGADGGGLLVGAAADVEEADVAQAIKTLQAQVSSLTRQLSGQQQLLVHHTKQIHAHEHVIGRGRPLLQLQQQQRRQRQGERQAPALLLEGVVQLEEQGLLGPGAGVGGAVGGAGPAWQWQQVQQQVQEQQATTTQLWSEIRKFQSAFRSMAGMAAAVSDTGPDLDHQHYHHGSFHDAAAGVQPAPRAVAAGGPAAGPRAGPMDASLQPLALQEQRLPSEHEASGGMELGAIDSRARLASGSGASLHTPGARGLTSPAHRTGQAALVRGSHQGPHGREGDVLRYGQQQQQQKQKQKQQEQQQEQQGGPRDDVSDGFFGEAEPLAYGDGGQEEWHSGDEGWGGSAGVGVGGQDGSRGMRVTGESRVLEEEPPAKKARKGMPEAGQQLPPHALGYNHLLPAAGKAGALQPPPEWLCPAAPPPPPPRKRGRPRKVLTVSELLAPVTQAAPSGRATNPRTVSAAARRLSQALGAGMWPKEAMVAGVQSSVLSCAAPRLTHVSLVEPAPEPGAKPGRGQGAGSWMGWAHPQVLRQGTLQALVDCLLEVDAAEPEPGSGQQQGRRAGAGVEGTLSSMLLRRLHRQVCSWVAEVPAAAGAGVQRAGVRAAPAQAQDRALALRGLQLQQTERCALAAAHALVCRQTNNLQVFRSFIMDLLALCVAHTSAPGPLPGFALGPQEPSEPPHIPSTHLLAPLYSALSMWPLACSPSPPPPPAPAAGSGETLLDTQDPASAQLPPPEQQEQCTSPGGGGSGGGGGAQPMQQACGAEDPIGAALHATLLHVLQCLTSATRPEAGHTAGPSSQQWQAQVTWPPCAVPGSVASESPSGSTGLEQEQELGRELAQCCLQLLTGSQAQQQLSPHRRPSLRQAQGVPPAPRQAPPLETCCAGLLGVVKWGLDYMMPPADDGDPWDVAQGRRQGLGRPAAGGAAAAGAVAQSTCMLSLLCRCWGFVATYDKVARVMLSWIPSVPVQQQVAVVGLVGKICSSCLAGRTAAGAEAEACLLLAEALVSGLDEGVGRGSRDVGHAGDVADAEALLPDVQHACVGAAVVCVASVAEEAEGEAAARKMAILRHVHAWGTSGRMRRHLLSPEADAVLQVFLSM